MQDGPTSLNEALPAEILTSIASYLEPAELANLRLVSRTFAALSDEAFDIVWQPHLEKLKQIDPTLSVIPPQGNTIPGWRQTQFREHFIRIAQQQMEEINHFKEHSENAKAAFAQITGPAKTLSQILEKEQLLNQFNANLIKSKVRKNSTKLNLSKMGLTRFPKQLFEDDALTSYWSALITLNFRNNLIKSLPDTLGTSCTAVQHLSCADNQLTVLPDTLGNLTALKGLYCQNNQLTALPDALGSCTALQVLFCQNNKLTVLPDLRNCTLLKWLHCYDNQLTALPDTLGNCTALQWLDCKNNRLTALPQSLVNCPDLQISSLHGIYFKIIPSEMKKILGENWYQYTMGSQNGLQKSSLLADVLKKSSNVMTKIQNYLKPLAKRCVTKLIEALKAPSQHPFTLGLMSAALSLGMGSTCWAFGPSLLIQSIAIGALVTAAIKTKKYFASQTLQTMEQQPNALSEPPSFFTRQGICCYQIGKACLDSWSHPLVFGKMPANNQGNITPENSAPSNNTFKP